MAIAIAIETPSSWRLQSIMRFEVYDSYEGFEGIRVMRVLQFFKGK